MDLEKSIAARGIVETLRDDINDLYSICCADGRWSWDTASPHLIEKVIARIARGADRLHNLMPEGKF